MELNSNNENVSSEEIEKLLNNYFQIILSGPLAPQNLLTQSISINYAYWSN